MCFGNENITDFQKKPSFDGAIAPVSASLKFILEKKPRWFKLKIFAQNIRLLIIKVENSSKIKIYLVRIHSAYSFYIHEVSMYTDLTYVRGLLYDKRTRVILQRVYYTYMNRNDLNLCGEADRRLYYYRRYSGFLGSSCKIIINRLRILPGFSPFSFLSYLRQHSAPTIIQCHIIIDMRVSETKTQVSTQQKITNRW